MTENLNLSIRTESHDKTNNLLQQRPVSQGLLKEASRLGCFRRRGTSFRRYDRTSCFSCSSCVLAASGVEEEPERSWVACPSGVVWGARCRRPRLCNPRMGLVWAATSCTQTACWLNAPSATATTARPRDHADGSAPGRAPKCSPRPSAASATPASRTGAHPAAPWPPDASFLKPWHLVAVGEGAEPETVQLDLEAGVLRHTPHPGLRSPPRPH
ncbi:unnamed protein product [Gadus morhua 'NCC']